MSRVFATKIPEPLLARLEEASQKEHKSKGALIRTALENFLNEREEERLAPIARITEAHFRNKKIKGKIDWTDIYRKAHLSAPDCSPEEEVRRSRRRNF